MHIRPIIHRDVFEVLEITEYLTPYWGREELISNLRQRNRFGYVVENDYRIVGFTAHETHKTSIEIIMIGVHPVHRRFGFGSALIERITRKLNPKRNSLHIEVPDDNLDLHLFLQAQGFTGRVTSSDLYRFDYKTRPVLS